MKLSELCTALGGESFCAGNAEKEITEAIAGDLLSFIMGSAREGAAWVTIQAHLNVAAVAVLKDIPIIIIAAGRKVPDDLIERCRTENIALLSVPESLFEVCAKMRGLGLKG